MLNGQRNIARLAAASLAASALVVACAPGAGAADAPRAVLAPVVGPVHPWEFAFGVDVTSQYISRGLANSEGPAVQPWAELTLGPVYFGYWGSNVSPSLVDATWEHDLSFGVRPTVGPLSLDFGYVRYVFDNGDCCGEIYAIVEVNPVEPLTLGASIFYDPDAANTYVEGAAAWAFHANLEASAAVGNQSFGDGTPSDFSWNAGLTWTPHEWVALDARYHAGPTANKVVFTASFSTSWSAGP